MITLVTVFLTEGVGKEWTYLAAFLTDAIIEITLVVIIFNMLAG